MSDIAIKIEGISKKYLVGKQKDSSLRGSLANIFKSKLNSYEEFWALDDVSFEVEKGDVVGIIGKNGAGKSTLLKILSKITKPTKGRIEINGRVASLLEVGTGFHPELTGRENIFLNGTILGMTRKEVKSKFDEIVAFSGVEKFIDTPVKHYSSGMYVRLAFAVAAHLDPEILIIDEVLAVGDIEFQKKCLGKMKDVALQGRTVLFVSHNMNAVNSLCSKCLYIKNGTTEIYDKTDIVISKYLNGTELNTYDVSFKENEESGDEFVKINSIRIINNMREPSSTIDINTPFGIEIKYEILNNQNRPLPNVHFHTSKGEFAFVSNHASVSTDIFSEGKYKSVVWIPDDLLNTGYYSIDVAMSTFSPSLIVHVWLKGILGIEVIEDISLRKYDYKQEMPGAVRPTLEWETVKIK